MDLHITLRSKSSSTIKPKPNLIKELQKLAKQSVTPTSRRNLLKGVGGPQTTRAGATGKSYENAVNKSKLLLSQGTLSNKRPVSTSIGKNTSKTGSKLLKKNSESSLVSNSTRKNSEPSLTHSSSTKITEINRFLALKPKESFLSSSKTSTKISISPPKKTCGEAIEKKVSTPRSIQKILKQSPRSGSSKKSLVFLPKPKKVQNNSEMMTSPRQSENLVTHLGSRTRTGTINGKPKPQNQDDYFIIPNFSQCRNQLFLGVMDGHGIFGHEVSAFVKRQLPLLIENNLPYEVTSTNDCSNESLNKIQKALTLGFTNTHKTLVSKRVIDVNYSGTTAITVLLRGRTLVCSSAGDSRAIIGRFDGSWSFVELSYDHKPSSRTEKLRIEAAGGRVEPYKEASGQFIGPDRVWLQHEQLPGLAMSRSIGDLVAAHVGVIAEPDIIMYELTEFDKFIVVATDGVWEFIHNQQCVNILAEHWINGDIEGACDKLVKESVQRWQEEDTVVDDITFIVAFLNVSNI